MISAWAFLERERQAAKAKAARRLKERAKNPRNLRHR